MADDQVKKKRKLSKTGKIVFSCLGLLCLFALYSVGILFFHTHFFPNTVLNQTYNISWNTTEEVKNRILQQAVGYEMTITPREGNPEVIKGTSIAFVPTFGPDFDDIVKSQDSFLWIREIFRPHSLSYTESGKYDENQLMQVLDQLNCLHDTKARKPKNAYISEYDAETNSFSIVPEDLGTTINSKKAYAYLGDCLKAMMRQVDLEPCYTLPAVRTDDETLCATLDHLNRYVQTVIQYDWNGSEVKLDSSTFGNWILVNGTEISYDEDAIKKWLSEQAYQYDTYGKERQYTTLDGRVKSLKNGGYGWRTDRSAELEALEEDIRSGETISKEPIYSYTAMQKGQDDIGNTFVEIDLSKQHLYLVEEGEVIFESDFVSGNLSNGNGTPPGLFGITYKERNATLKGANYTSKVSYWMPFNGNIGMHDATWRREFGGDIYITSGSHGCINLPLLSAQFIFDHVDKGYPVICYY